MTTIQVETYEVEEALNDELQALAIEGETIELIEQLGLTGQQALINPETKNFTPYRHLTADERFVFKLLFPNRAALKEYKAGPIPLRVLQVAAHVIELDNPSMAYLEVWYPKQGIDDPVLIARPNSYGDPCFLLARWGKELMDFSALQEQAKFKAIEFAKGSLMRIKAQIESLLANPESAFLEKIADGEIPNPTFYL